jgi:putative PEP-CTERM system histidine kinase
MLGFYQIIIGLSLLILIGCELWVLFKSVRGVSKTSFLFLNLSFIFFLSGYLWLWLKVYPAQTDVSFYLLACGLIFTPPLWLLFSSTLGREDSKAELKKGMLAFVPFFCLSLVFLLWQIKGSLILLRKDIFGDVEFYLGVQGKFFLIFLLAGAVLSILNLEKTFHSSTQAEKKRLAVPFIFSLALLLMLIYLITYAFLYVQIPDFAFLSQGFLGILWSISLARYLKEKGISIQITRQVVYSSTVAILIGGYLIIVGLIAKLIQSFGGSLSVFLSVLAAFLVIVILSALVVSGSIKDRIKRFVDQSFYKGKVDYRGEWTRFSENIASLLDLEEILKEIAGVILTNLRSRDVIILLPEPENDFSITYPKESSLNLRIKKEEEFLDWIFRYGEPVGIKEIGFEKFSTEEGRLFLKQLMELKLELCVPMIAKRNLIGLLLLRAKESNQPFTEEDFSFLGGVAHQSSIAILNAKLSEELIISKEMESFNKLSSFILHDLKNFVSMLSLLLQNAEEKLKNPDFQKSALSTISDTVERMKKLMGKLSSASEGIRLDLKSYDLNEIINSLLERMKVSNFTRIKLVLNFGSLPAVKCDQTQMDKVFQNLIINALEAMSEGGILSIITEFDEKKGLVRTRLSDTGAGISRDFIRNNLFKPFQTTKKKGLGIGLFQCREIVELHRGRLLVESEEGKGTTFAVELPL